jgi:hypothetical protein
MTKIVKQILRSCVLGGTLFFLAATLRAHWQEVANIRIDGVGWSILVIATGVTLLAHTWAAWVWTWILKELQQPIHSAQFIQVYLKTNIAKYLPGNVWHFYGRMMAAKSAGVSNGAATLSVLLEPLLMAAAALIIVLLSSQFAVQDDTAIPLLLAQLLGLLGVLCVVHPKFLNLGIRLLHRLKIKKSTMTQPQTLPLSLGRYPLRPLLGELGFLGLRGLGFILTLFAIGPLHVDQIPLLLGTFSFAWLLGLILPGAPGGLGVFEATAITLLQFRFPTALVITAVGLYRLISILAETAGAALGWLDERLFLQGR